MWKSIMRRILRANGCRYARPICILELYQLFVVQERRVTSCERFYKLADGKRELHKFPFILLSI